MDVRLKERLIGALVLVALAVLVLPWVLDDEKGRADFESQIPPAPPAPAARSVELSQPRPLAEAGFDDSIIAAETSTTSSEQLSDPEQPANAEQPAGTETQLPAPAQSVVAERPAPIQAGYVIQLGSFSNRDNAEKLVENLRAQKLAAYSKLDRSSTPPVVRVWVGPVVKREQAEAQLAKVRTLSGLNAMVVSYDPLKH